MAFIEASKLSKRYDLGGASIVALNNVTISIDRGEFVAIIGPSGSGKSTLMHILGLLDEPTSGQYLLGEVPTTRLEEESRAALRSDQIGFIFQQFNLLARTSALDNVLLPIQYHHNKRHAVARATAMLVKVGLGDRLQNYPNQLSGGQQQRVAIARALINDPQIIFADEPTGNLDTKSGAEVMKILDGLASEGKTVIMVTHEPAIAAHASRVVTIRDGQIISDREQR